MSHLKSLVSGNDRRNINTRLWLADLKNQSHTFSSHNLKNPISKPFSRRPMLVLPLNSDFAPLFSVSIATHHNTGKMKFSDNQEVPKYYPCLE